MIYKILLVLYLIILFVFLLFINLHYLEGIPHVPDSVAYLFMAKMFTAGQVNMPIPISPEHFNFFPGILSVEKGTWLFQYPFGHPILLALGIFIGLPNIIPPILGTLVVLLIFLIAKEIYGKKAALFSIFLSLFSPFFLENASSFMSHNTASFYLMLSVFFAISAFKNIKYAIFSGMFIGLLFNTRPLTAIAFLPILLIVLLYKSKLHKRNVLLCFIAGILPFISLWLLYNKLTTGEPLLSQYYLINNGMLELMPTGEALSSFIDNHIKNTIVLFNNFGPMLFNWPIFIAYGIILIPFILRKNNFWDNIFFLSLFTLPLAYFFYNGQFLMYGPRFWYEILPFAFLLTARGFSLLSDHSLKITIIIFIILATISLNKLFGIISTKDPDMMSPLSLEKLRGINGVDSRITEIIKENDIHNALVFIKGCGSWWCYGSIFSQNSPKLDTDIVYAKDLGDEKNKKIINHFRTRSFYKLDYYQNQLTHL